MENYLITNKTIGLLKKNNKTIIYNVDNIEVINKNIKNIIEFNCNYYGSSIQARKKYAENIIDNKYKIPLIIDESNNLVLIQFNSMRSEECLFLITNKIVDYNYDNKKLKIFCVNNNNFYVKISKNSFEKLLINAIKLNNVLNYRKYGNLL